MKVFIGTDHSGYELKENIRDYLEREGFNVEDMGAHTYDKDDDYPDFVRPVAIEVSQHPGAKGILLGKTGQGEAMCANRFEGVRAAVWYGGEKEILKLSREHNNANILSLGAGFITEDNFIDIKNWLETPFSEDERHIRRLTKFR